MIGAAPITLQGSIAGKTTQIMTATIANYPCGSGLVCFGDDGIGGTVGVWWGIDPLNAGVVYEWGVADGEDRLVAGSDVFEVWERRQREYDEHTLADEA